jgi:hypothetical protein
MSNEYEIEGRRHTKPNSNDLNLQKMSKWQRAQLEYKNRAVYQMSLMKNSNYWTQNNKIIDDYKKCYQVKSGSFPGGTVTVDNHKSDDYALSLRTDQAMRKTFN